jgi:hypothetical protein
VTLPQGVVVDRLRMSSPSDIWASAHINASTNVGYDQTAVVLHYDGTHWQQVSIGASGHPQFVQAFDRGTTWAFSLQHNPLAMDIISSAHCQNNGGWHAVRWPMNNVSMGFVTLGGTTIQRVSADEYWAIAWHQPSNGPVTTVLLYFASGIWHEYGR